MAVLIVAFEMLYTYMYAGSCRAIQAIAYPRCLASTVALYYSSPMTVVHLPIGLGLASHEQSQLLRFVHQHTTRLRRATSSTKRVVARFTD